MFIIIIIIKKGVDGIKEWLTHEVKPLVACFESAKDSNRLCTAAFQLVTVSVCVCVFRVFV